MHHPAAGDLQPALAHLTREGISEIDLETWLGVAEVMRPETNLRLRPHQLAKDKLHCALEISNVDAFVDV